MKYLPTTIIVTVLACSIALSTQLPQVDQTQVTFLTADTAEVSEIPDGRVAILVTGLDSELGHGVIVKPEGNSNWIEAWRNGEFPPEVIDPLRPGEYLIRGQPGDKFWLRIDRHPERPIYDTAIIESGGQDPTPPPISDWEAVEKLSRDKSQALNDPTTAAALRQKMLETIPLLDGLELSRAKQVMVGAITMVMAERTGSSVGVDWYGGWRVPMNVALGAVETTAEYIAACQASADGLKPL